MKPVFRIALLIMLTCMMAQASVEVWDGGRTIPLHRLPINDEDNVDIVPQIPHAMPFSARNTCGICHNYGTISTGWHFNSSHTNVPPGRIGEPWVWADHYTGTQIPLSYRPWSGMFHPEKLGITPWMFTKEFARHMPGGDMAEPCDPYDGHDSRWNVSGTLEVNCLGCHNGSHLQDHTEWVKQVQRENYRWASTAASGLGEVEGMASRIDETWRPAQGENLDDRVWAVPPSVTYDLKNFDAKNRVLFNVRKPSDQRCFACHSVTPSGMEKIHADGDVHTRAGLRCVDCHRNGLGHDITRNYESEQRGFSCKECHDAGRLGAPIPKHHGLPPIHLEKLSCTACHSGEMIGQTATRMRTARANRLNIYGKAQWFTEAPFIEEPVLAKGDDGKLTPHRVMWPAFWARRDGDKLTPLLPAAVTNAATGILDAELQINKYLVALNQLTEDGKAVFVTGGEKFAARVDGGLDVSDQVMFWGRETAYGIVPLSLDVVEVIRHAPVADVLAALDGLQKADRAMLLCAGQKFYLNADGRVEMTNTTETVTAWGVEKAGQFTPFRFPVMTAAAQAVLATNDAQEISFQAEPYLIALDTLRRTEKLAHVSNGRVHRAGVEPTTWINKRAFFARERDGLIAALTPDFDPEAERIAMMTENKIMEVFRLLQSDETLPQPVALARGRKVYQRTEGVLMTGTNAVDVGAVNNWGLWRDGKLEPFVPDFVVRAIEQVTGTVYSFNEEQLAMVLKALGKDAAYVCAGKVFSLDAAGKLAVGDAKEAEPVLWPLGHDVRPAGMSLGAKSCQECHAPDAPFFQGKIVGMGPLLTAHVMMKQQYQFEELDAKYQSLFGWSFQYRPLFKRVLWVTAGFIGLMVLAFLLHALRRWSRRLGGHEE